MMSKEKSRETEKLTADGLEKPDPRPMQIPVGVGVNESMDARIARILQHSMSMEAARQGFETFDEADDFDIPDDPADPSTPWETDFDLAGAHAAERGIVQPPNITAERAREVKEKVSRKPKKNPPPSEEDTPLPLESTETPKK